MGIEYNSKQNFKQANKLAKKLKPVENKLGSTVSKIAIAEETSNIFWSKLNKEIRTHYKEAKIICDTWVLSNIQKTFNEKIKTEIKKINSRSIKPKGKTQIQKTKDSDFTAQTLQALTVETSSALYTGLLSGQNTLIRLTRLTQQNLLTEQSIDKSIVKGFLEKGSLYGSKKKLQKELLKKAVEGKYITIIDKNGKPRQYTMAYYAELVARTKLQEAAAQATINTALSVGSDLIQISSHNTTTEICMPYEGKIFSITGSDKQFPRIDRMPPFHPNCKHSSTVVIKDILEINNTLDDYIAFSNGQTEIHPTLTAYIPLSQRGKK